MSSVRYFRNFSHLYIEQGARQYALTDEILAAFPRASVIEIDNYKEVFNRYKQEWRAQKRAPKLVLALKRAPFLYPTTEVIPSVEFPHSYYTTPLINCVYDCHYCYLQGMYPSAHMVLFVNCEDFYAATTDKLATERPLHLSLSYDTDLLAFEGIAPLTSHWIEFARSAPDLFLEVRTKSVNVSAISHLPSSPRVILAWTLSPDAYATKFERGAPPLHARLRAACDAVKMGWKVRICIDPVLKFAEWRAHYATLLEQIFSQSEAEGFYEFSIGTFRMNRDHFRRAARLRPESELFQVEYQKRGSLIGHSASEVEEVYSLFKEFFAARSLPANVQFALPLAS